MNANVINIKKYKIKEIIIFTLLIIFLIFNNTFAEEIDYSEYEEHFTEAIEHTLFGEKVNIQETFYQTDKEGLEDTSEKESLFVVELMNTRSNGWNIFYNENIRKLCYRPQTEGKQLPSVPIDISLIEYYTENNETKSRKVTLDNSQVYVTKEGKCIMQLTDLDREKIKSNKYVFEISAPDILKETMTLEPKKGKYTDNTTVAGDLWEGFKGATNWAVEKIGDVLSGILNHILLAIADGLNSMVNTVLGSNDITVYKIIFGKEPKLSINYWGGSSSSGGTVDGNGTGIAGIGNPPVAVLKNPVSNLYKILFTMAIAVYVVMLLYIAIKILLSSTGSSREKYKESLTAWVVGIILLGYSPVIMKYIVKINDATVMLLDKDINESSQDIMADMRKTAEDTNNMVLTIAYIIMIGQLVVLIGIYYKRVFMLAFLITIFPIVGTLYIWEKVNRGSSHSVKTWFKEFAVLVIVQVFHAVVYVILIEGAYVAYNHSQKGNWIFLILCISFLFKAEKIIRSIFDIKSSTNSIGDLASAGVAAWATVKTVNNIFSKSPNSSNKDESDYKDELKNVKDLERQESVNDAFAIHRREDEEAEKRDRILATSENESENTNASDDNELKDAKEKNNIELAKSRVKAAALKSKKKKNGILGKAVNTAARATGITLGVTSGLAQGSVSQGLANAVVANSVMGGLANGVNSISGFARGVFSGGHMYAKIRSKNMDEKLGIDKIGKNIPTTDGEITEEIRKNKQEIYRRALARQYYVTRLYGKEAGELAYIDVIEKETRRREE